ncbi:MAG: decarboxylating 6-phosphogluconate dehydrogenase [Acidobacteria bacterium]|nr:decarboxylating 6-phosphogluconate dehydrogenase [Acidobacteriota bacterium]
MQLGMIGLGRMGANMTRRLARDGHAVTVFDLSAARVRELAAEGATGAASIDDLVRALSPPRIVWIMVPAGEPTEKMVAELATRLQADDTIVDGGNTYFKDDVRRAQMLEPRGIHYVDVGTSGGLWGLERGYSLMIGGPRATVLRLDPIFATLAPSDDGTPPTPGGEGRGGTAARGYLHCGPAGAGHFVKMVHNGIEYGLMQAYAEGFDILRTAATGQRPEAERYRFDLGGIAEVWRHGSVVSSWLLDLTAMALAEDPELAAFSGFVQDSGEGRWTIEAAIEQAAPADVLATSLFARFRSRQDHTFGEKVLSAMRHKFGGHVERSCGG